MEVLWAEGLLVVGGPGGRDGFEVDEAFEDEAADGGFLGLMGLEGLLEGVDEGGEGGEGLKDGVEEAGVAQIS